MKAPDILKRASDIMDERAKQYDSPQGERSMGKAVAAFNAITGQSLSEANGWLLMALLKMVRDNTTDKPHEDSLHDLVAYGALYGEARLSTVHEQRASESAGDDGEWIEWGDGEHPLKDSTPIMIRLQDLTEFGPIGYWYACRYRNDIIAYRIVK